MKNKEREVLRTLLKNYTKIWLNGGIAKVIFDDEFENVAAEIVKLFDIVDYNKSAIDKAYNAGFNDGAQCASNDISA